MCLSQEIVPLWGDKIPNQNETGEKEISNKDDILRIENVQEPAIEVYLPSKANATGKAVIICPGGAYRFLAYDWEGTDIAKWLNSKGIAAFVLKYRLPVSQSLIIPYKAPLQDAQRAIRLVRKNAAQWNISARQIGIMGFSAGGHLAATLGTRYDYESDTSGQGINSYDTRPDFMILLYPVISMKDCYTHQGSRDNLLGPKPGHDLVDFYSNELHVSSNTPPAFIVHSGDDPAVPVINSILFYQALQREGIYSEMHLYPEGGHGFSLATGMYHLRQWPERLFEWIESLD